MAWPINKYSILFLIICMPPICIVSINIWSPMILYFACFFEVLESAKGELPSKYSFLPSGWPQQSTRMLSEIEDYQNHHPLLEYIILASHSKVAHRWLGLMLNFPVFKWLIISTIMQHSKDPYTWGTRNSSHIANKWVSWAI